MELTKLLIEVRGGVIQNIISTDEVRIVIVDHDNIEQFEQFRPNVFSPDCITAYGKPIWEYYGEEPNEEEFPVKEKLKSINF